MKHIVITILVSASLVLPGAVWATFTPFTSDNPYFSQQSVNKKYKKQNIKRSNMYAKKSKRSYSVPGKISGNGKNTFVFYPSKLMWGAYDGGGNLVKKGRASGGKGYCADVRRSCRTPVGTFSIYAKRGPGCRSSKYPIPRGGAPMPYCMFFRGGYAIHGSPDVPNYNASHGCIRVLPSAAKWLSKNFIRHGTRVIVRSY